MDWCFIKAMNIAVLVSSNIYCNKVLLKCISWLGIPLIKLKLFVDKLLIFLDASLVIA